MKYIGYIEVCYIEEPFICSVHGNFTIEALNTIEDDLKKDEYNFNGNYEGKELVRFAVHFVGTETQYGTGYGDILTIPSYYDLTCVCEK